MATEVKIPPLGESITSGILAEWHVSDGDFVQQGQSLFELETDKITSEGTAEASGTIELKVEQGTEVEIGSVVAVIDESAEGHNEAKADTNNTDDKDNKDNKDEEEPAPEKEQETKAEEKPPSPPAQHPPSVRRIAGETGIDPDKVEGSGKAGRVTKGDMLSAAKQSEDSSASAKSGDSPRETRRKMNPLRRTIAKRLVQAQQSMAMLTTFNEVDMSAVIELRRRYKEPFIAKYGVKLGFMSFFVKAAIEALKEFPSVNAEIRGDNIVYKNYFNIGIAVGGGKGLVVPVIRDTQELSFAGIEMLIADFGARGAKNRIALDELTGGTFSISNGGVYGSLMGTPILNPPQSGILGLHAIKERPVVSDGEIVARPMMNLALTYDHRVVDGRESVGFLVKIKEVIEDPARLFLEV